jgi:hypothetical protein
MVIGDFDSSTTFMQASLELDPSSPLGPFDFTVLDGARTPSGNLLLQASEGGAAYLLYEVEPDGTGSGYGPGQLTTLVGSGDDLTLMTFGPEQVAIQPYAGGAVVPVAIPGFAFETSVADRRARFAIAHEEYDPAGSSTAHLTEFDEDGVVARTLVIPRFQYDYASPSAVAVGEDDAIYLAVHESEPGGLHATYLHRIAPL